VFKGKNLPFINAKSVKFARIVERIAEIPFWISSVIILLPTCCFFILEFLFEKNNVFSLSGSFPLVIAVWATYTNHYIGINIEYLRHFYNQTCGIDPLAIRKPETINYLANSKNHDGEELKILDVANKRLVKVQFIGGIVGTIILTFGDQIINYFN
jgi:hypothetical protein